jgi:hypothetical protein
MKQPTLLFVSSAHPGGSGFIGAGEGICESSLRRWLSAGYRVHVLCFASPRQQPNPELVALCESYQTAQQTTAQSILGVIWGWRNGSLLAPWFFTRSSPQHIQLLQRKVSDLAPDRIWVDFSSSLGFLPYLDGVPSDYFAHDVVSQNVGRRWLLSVLARHVQTVEARLTQWANRCFVLSEKDKRLLRTIGFAGDVLVWPPGATPIGRVRGCSVSAVVQGFGTNRNLVFFGNMARPENHWSMMHFVAFDFGKIRRAYPDAHLWVIGLEPHASLKWLAKVMTGVHITGAIDDPLPALRSATLCIAPLRLGAGVKIKVLQMLQAGATVVATPVAAEGIEAQGRLVVADVVRFADVVCQQLAARSTAVPAEREVQA